MRILVFGNRGQLARALARAADGTGHHVTALGRAACNIANADAVTRVVESVEPEAIVNAAAYTNVDGAEDESEAAFRINADAPATIARVAARSDIPLVHVSTDFVFDGEGEIPYIEDDERRPLNVYGQSKAVGEDRVRAVCPKSIILRTSWLYDAEGDNFLTRILRRGAEREELRVVDDQFGSPTFAGDLAHVCLSLLDRRATDATGGAVYHAAGRGVASRHGWAQAIFREAAAQGLPVPERIVPVSSTEFPTRARRPRRAILDTRRIEETFDIALRDWQTALADCMAEMTRTEPAS